MLLKGQEDEMDTTEGLNGTYFYGGVGNLTPHELLFWVLLDETSEQLGVKDFVGVATIILGDNSVDVPGKPLTSTKGTSPASLFFRKHISFQFRKRVLPTLTKKSFSVRGLKIFWVNNLGAFVGRAVPVLGWVILASDLTQIAYKTVHHYNLLVQPEDKIW